MGRTLCRLLSCFLWVPAGALAAQGTSPDPAPTRTEWLAAGIGFSLSLGLDRELESIGLGEDRGFDGLARAANRVGRARYYGPALGGAYLLGRVGGSQRLERAVLHAAAGLLASGIVNGAGKALFGRQRPDLPGADGWDFRPGSFTENDWQSLPSGHAVIAFSLASALAEETESPLVSALGWLAAGTVGWSRIYDNEHWTSDVVAGAVIGTFVTRYTIRRLHARELRNADDPSRAPSLVIGPEGIAVVIPVR